MPSKQRLDAYLAEWVQGQRLSPATLTSYRKNIRLHIDPYLGAQPVARLTGPMVDAWMRKLEASGRADGQGGLSARTVRPGRARRPTPARSPEGQAGRAVPVVS